MQIEIYVPRVSQREKEKWIRFVQRALAFLGVKETRRGLSKISRERRKKWLLIESQDVLLSSEPTKVCTRQRTYKTLSRSCVHTIFVTIFLRSFPRITGGMILIAVSVFNMPIKNDPLNFKHYRCIIASMSK